MKTIHLFILGLLLAMVSQTVVAQISQPEFDALKALYNSTNGNNWTNKTGWENINSLTANDITVNSLFGVTIDGTGAVKSVIAIDLHGKNLVGNIPSEIGNLTNLIYLFLGNNGLTGKIPVEIGKLVNLQALMLEYNQLIGNIPVEICNLTILHHLGLAVNQLNGNIPAEIGKLTNLDHLGLDGNQLKGDIPSEIGNLTNLKGLHLGYNELTVIPNEIGNLINLQFLDLNNNSFQNNIPTSIGKLANLVRLWLQNNQLSGTIPFEICNLTNLYELRLDSNQLSGNIPSEVRQKLTILKTLQLENNLFGCENTAEIAALTARGNWTDFTHSPQNNGINFSGCSCAEREALKALYDATDGANWTHNDNWWSNLPVSQWYGITCNDEGCVTEIKLDTNNLVGKIPSEIENLKNLTWLSLDNNKLSGIPATIGNLTNLYVLNLNGNRFDCTLPVDLYNLTNLWVLNIGNAGIKGEIPTGISKLKKLGLLNLSTSLLSGNIPDEIGELTNLNHLNLNGCFLKGGIPKSMYQLTNLQYLGLAYNYLEGFVSSEIGNLINLIELRLDYNQLTGTIPTTIRTNLINLQKLNIDHNLFGWENCPEVKLLINKGIDFTHSPQTDGVDFNFECDMNNCIAKINITNPAKVQLNKTFDIVVNTSQIKATGINTYRYTFDFNPLTLQYVSPSFVGTFAENATATIIETSAGHLTVEVTSTTPLKGAGKLLKLTFKALAVGSSELKIANFAYNTLLTSCVENATVSIVKPSIAKVSYAHVNGNALKNGHFPVGKKITITVTFTEPVADAPVPQFVINGANTLTATSMSKKSDTVYTYTYTVTDGRGAAKLSLVSGNDWNGFALDSISEGNTFQIIRLGDIDNDKHVDSKDASLALLHSIGLDTKDAPLPWDGWRTQTADVDNDATVTYNDAVLILQKAVNLITDFPANNKKSMKSVADVDVSIEDGFIVFRSMGDFSGMNLSADNAKILEKPIRLHNKFAMEDNISKSVYKVGLASSETAEKGKEIMKIRMIENGTVIFNIFINNKMITKTAVGTGTEEIIVKAPKISVYPNPTHDYLKFNNVPIGTTANIYNLNGMLIKTIKLAAEENEIDVSNLTNGTYIIKFQNGKKVETKRFVKQ